MGPSRLCLLKLECRHLSHLIAQLQLLHRAVQRCQLALQGSLLGLQRRQGDIRAFSSHHDLILKVLQLPHQVGVILLHLAVLDGIKLFPHGIVCLVQPVVGLVFFVLTAHHFGRSHHQAPLRLGDPVELLPQVLVQLIVVDILDDVDVPLERQDAQVVLPHPALHVGKGELAGGIGLQHGQFRIVSTRGDSLLRDRSGGLPGGLDGLGCLLCGIRLGLRRRLRLLLRRHCAVRFFSGGRRHGAQGQHQRQDQQQRDTSLFHMFLLAAPAPSAVRHPHLMMFSRSSN